MKKKKIRQKIRVPESTTFDFLDGNKNVHRNDYVEYSEKKNRYLLKKSLFIDLLLSFAIVTIRESEEMFLYNERKEVWVREAKTYLHEVYVYVMQDNSKQNEFNEVLACIKAKTYHSERELPNLPPFLLPVANGFVNLEEGILEDPTKYLGSDYFFLSRLSVVFNEKATCPAFEKFLSEILEKTSHKLILGLLGYCLTSSYYIHKAFMFVGKGANGKSTLLLVFERFLGSENISNVELQDIVNNRFKLAELHEKMANIAADLPSFAITKTGCFKSITGGDWICAERKNKHPFNFQNRAKLIFSCNEIPASQFDDTDAYYRRWIIVEFKKQFKGKEAIPQELLLSKMTTENEKSGLLNVVLKELKELNERKRFLYEDDFEKQRMNYIVHSDSVKAFATFCCEESSGSFVSKEELYGHYVNYCSDNERTPKLNNVFAREIKRWIKGIEPTKKKTGSGRKPFWMGIKIKTSELSEMSGIDFLPSSRKFSIKNEGKKILEAEVSANSDISDSSDTNFLYKKVLGTITDLIWKPNVGFDQRQTGISLDIARKKYINDFQGKEKDFNETIKILLKDGKAYEPKNGYISLIFG